MGNAWFQINKASILKNEKNDWPIYILGLLGNKNTIKTVVELGCANGWRLNRLREKLKNVKCIGVDASFEAIEDGKARYPELSLTQGVLSQVPLEDEFDLVIVNFVLHWVDRETLTKSMSEIDRLTKDGGFLILGDFLPDFPQRRHYHHLPGEEVYTYKQDYAKIFESFGTYKEIIRITYDHDHPGPKVQPSSSSARAFCAILQKSLHNYYCDL